MDKISPYHLPSLGIQLPSTIAGLEYKMTHSYYEPELGMSLLYSDGRSTWADVYEYDKGITLLRDGIYSKSVIDEFFEAQDSILMMVENGEYESAFRLAEQVIPAEESGMRDDFLHAVYMIRSSSEAKNPFRNTDLMERSSHIFITAFGGQFIKIRYTYPEDKDDEIGPLLLKFVSEIFIHIYSKAEGI